MPNGPQITPPSIAGEMQSASLFPPTLLLALPQGQLYFHICLELIAGLSTWFLVRELGLSPGVAAVGGIMFALNGTLAWFGSAPANPVAFLPLALLGVERLFRRAGPDPRGWLLLACSLALSVYAGFPETAYMDGLFVAAWFIFRLAGHPAPGRRQFAARVALGAAVGVMLAAPVLIAFLGYLPIADVGRNAALGNLHLPAGSAPLIGLPYLYGPLYAFSADARPYVLNFGGGFITAPVLAMACIGVVAGRLERGLRALLAAVAITVVLWDFGAPPISTVLERVVPFSDQVLVSRFSEPVWELAFVLLACLGVERIATRGAARAVVVGGGLFALAVVAADLAIAWPTVTTIYHHAAAYHAYPVMMVAWAVALVAGVTAAAMLTGRRALGSAVVAALLSMDALAMFVAPQLSAPRSVAVDLGPADYLAAHLGDGRFFSLGVYRPNYGSYFGLASADVDDLPVPTLWASYVEQRLSTNTSPLIFDGSEVRNRRGPSADDELVARLAAYEAIDVAYVLARTGSDPFGAPRHLEDGVTQVYSDHLVTIYELPDPRPYFSTDGGPCRLSAEGDTTVVARCGGTAMLVRSELDLPGWSAVIDGRPATLGRVDGGVMSVRLPDGTSVVSFTYLPPHEDLALAVFGVGVLAVVAVALLWGRSSRRRRFWPARRLR